MLQCYAKLTFTIPARYRTAMTVEGCRDAALENIDQKMRYQTESIRAWSVLCYDAILKSDCSQIGTAAFFNPACVRLRDESTQALQRRP
ncbi:MAG: hypothetical protein K1X75_04395 [Leptospirales bacterium]|nr:hypothetical protein [Leptospirales bacterium]